MNAFYWCELHYVCPNCQEEWEDAWDSEVDDECPNCGTRDIQPVKVVPVQVRPEEVLPK